MRTASTRSTLALDAISAVLEALSRLPSSNETQSIAAQARACERIVQSWSLFPPTDEEREALMKRVLDLHIAAAQVRRDSEPPSRTRRTGGDDRDPRE